MTSSNIQFIGFAFTVYIAIVTMMALSAITKPYNEHQVQIKMLRDEIIRIKWEQDNDRTGHEDKLQRMIEICESLIEVMKEYCAAPRIFGIYLTQSKLTILKGIVTIIFLGIVGKIAEEMWDKMSLA